MPFTLSHSGVALLFRRREWGIPQAVAVGAMMPDAHYYFPVVPRYWWNATHTPLGALAFCLPLGILTLGVVQFFRHELASLSGIRVEPVFQQMAPLRFAGHLAAICANVILGTFSHLVLDAFTHRSGYVVRTFPWLVNFRIHDMAPYAMMQVVLSIILLLALFRFWKTQLSSEREMGVLHFFCDKRRVAIFSGALLAGTANALYWLLKPRARSLPLTFADLHFDLMTRFVAAASVALFAGLCWLKASQLTRANRSLRLEP